MGNPWPGESEKVDLRWLCKAWKLGGFSRSNRISMQKICVAFTLGDEFNRMKHDGEMIRNTSKHIENHCFFFVTSTLLSFGAFQGVSKACQQHLLVLPVVQVRFLFLKNLCVSRCDAWQRYHDCTLLQRASAFIACSNLREEDFLFFWVQTSSIFLTPTGEVHQNQGLTNSWSGQFNSSLQQHWDLWQWCVWTWMLWNFHETLRSVFVSLPCFLICPRQS